MKLKVWIIDLAARCLCRGLSYWELFCLLNLYLTNKKISKYNINPKYLDLQVNKSSPGWNLAGLKLYWANSGWKRLSSVRIEFFYICWLVNFMNASRLGEARLLLLLSSHNPGWVGEILKKMSEGIKRKDNDK